MIKKKASTLYALVRNHSHIRRDLRASFKKHMLSLFFKILQNPKFLRRDYVRGFESRLFHVSITQDSLVDTLKFINPGEARNNLYADSFDKKDEPIWSLVPSLEDEQRTKCGGVVGTPYLIIINIILINKINRW
jgi:hypothetical protein